MLDHPATNGTDYAWYKVNIFTRWWLTGRNRVIIFDPPPTLRMWFPTPILDEMDLITTHDPYHIHLRFPEELARVRDESVWSIQDLPRHRELVRAKHFYKIMLSGEYAWTSSISPNPDYLPSRWCKARYPFRRNFGRCWITVDRMTFQHYHFAEDSISVNGRVNIERKQTRDLLLLCCKVLQNLRYRSEANRERL
jgi:hypothetical protein